MLNVMLSFLSTVRLTRDNSQIDKKDYPALECDGLGMSHFTNESAFRRVITWLADKNMQLDGYIGITSTVVEQSPIDEKNGFLDIHLAYIKNRFSEILKKSYPEKQIDIEKFLKTVHYNEVAEEDASLTYVLEIVQIARKLQAEANDGKVNLYLDITGGPRNANMLILIISRMLAYDENIKVIQVLYSDLQKNKGSVKSIYNAYNLLDLVAGISEFINFGSVKGLNAYFDTIPDSQKSKYLLDLLEAMKKFSQRAMLCRYGEFVRAINDLKESMQAFKLNYTKRENKPFEEIVYSFLERINDKYADLFVKSENKYYQDLRIIRWCYENDYIQQAMTLITERVPEYFFEEEAGLLAINEDYRDKLETRLKEYREKNKDGDDYDIYTWIMFQDVESPASNKNGFMSRVNSIVRTQIDNIILHKKVSSRDSLLYSFNNAEESYKCVGRSNKEEVINNILAFYDFCLPVDIKKPIRVEGEALDLVVNKNLMVYPQYTEMSLKNFRNAFNGKQIKGAEKLSFYELVGGTFKEDKYKKNVGNFKSVENKILKKILLVKCDEDTFLDILYKYYEIKKERNVINHAHDKEETISIVEIKKKILALITGLEDIENERNTHK